MNISEFVIEIDEAKKQKKKKKAISRISTGGAKKIQKFKQAKAQGASKSLAARATFGTDKQKAGANKTIKQLVNTAASLAFSDVEKVIRQHGLRNIKKTLGREDIEKTKVSPELVEHFFNIELDEASKVEDEKTVIHMIEATLSKKTFFTKNFGTFTRVTPGSQRFADAFKLEIKKKLNVKEMNLYSDEKEKAFVNTMRNYLGGAFFFYAFSGAGDNLIQGVKKYDEIKKQDVFNFVNNTFSKFLALSPKKKLFGDVLRSQANTLKIKLRDLFFNEDGTKKANISQIMKEAESTFKGLTNGRLLLKPSEFFTKTFKEKEEKIKKQEEQTFKKKYGTALDTALPGYIMEKLNVNLFNDKVNVFPDAQVLSLMSKATPEQIRIFKNMAGVEMKTGKYKITAPSKKVLEGKGILSNKRVDFDKLKKNLKMFGLPTKLSTIYIQKGNTSEDFIKIYKSNVGKLINNSRRSDPRVQDVKYVVGKGSDKKTFDLRTIGGNYLGFNISDKDKKYLWKDRPEITLTYDDFRPKLKDIGKKVISGIKDVIKNVSAK